AATAIPRPPRRRRRCAGGAFMKADTGRAGPGCGVRGGLRVSARARMVVALTPRAVALPMPEISTFLTVNDQAEEAARFYTSIFPNSKITRITRYPDLGPQAPFKPGGVMTVEFTLNGRPFTALNGGPQFSFSQGISIAVVCDTQEEVDQYWTKFVE